MTLSLKNNVNVAKKIRKTINFYVPSFWRSLTNRARSWSGTGSESRSVSQRYGPRIRIRTKMSRIRNTVLISDPHQRIYVL